MCEHDHGPQPGQIRRISSNGGARGDVYCHGCGQLIACAIDAYQRIACTDCGGELVAIVTPAAAEPFGYDCELVDRTCTCAQPDYEAEWMLEAFVRREDGRLPEIVGAGHGCTFFDESKAKQQMAARETKGRTRWRGPVVGPGRT